MSAPPFWFVRNLLAVLLVGGLLTTGYFLLNHYPLWEPRELPMTPLDGVTPFWLWTVWPYLLMMVSEALLPLTIRNTQVFRRMVAAYLIGIGLAFPCYALLPTTYPRPPCPTDDSLTSQAYCMLIAIDTPHNCFPSGHVLFPALGCWAVWLDGRRWAPWLTCVLVLCVPTILTTKQHYVWDLLGAGILMGISMAAASYLVPLQTRGSRLAPATEGQ